MRLLLVAASLCLASCAGVGQATSEARLTADLPRYPACDGEIKAFIALTKLARQLGPDWTVYEPALQALQDQILDCVDDNYPDPVAI